MYVDLCIKIIYIYIYIYNYIPSLSLLPPSPPTNFTGSGSMKRDISLLFTDWGKAFVDFGKAWIKDPIKDALLSRGSLCSHNIVGNLFAYSINKCRFDPPNPNGSFCTMGYHTNNSCRGDWIVATTDKKPFC